MAGGEIHPNYCHFERSETFFSTEKQASLPLNGCGTH